MLATIALSSGYLPKKCSRVYAPPLALKFWYSPSTHSSMTRRRSPWVSRASSGSQREPHSTLMTFQNFKADRKSTRLNSSHSQISYAVFCLKKKIDLETSVLHQLRHLQLVSRSSGRLRLDAPDLLLDIRAAPVWPSGPSAAWRLHRRAGAWM